MLKIKSNIIEHNKHDYTVLAKVQNYIPDYLYEMKFNSYLITYKQTVDLVFEDELADVVEFTFFYEEDINKDAVRKVFNIDVIANNYFKKSLHNHCYITRKQWEVFYKLSRGTLWTQT